MTTKTYKVKFRRRREEKTNYSKRLALVRYGKQRLVVRKTNKAIYLQVIAFDRHGDKVITQANSRELEKFGWKKAKRNTPSAYLAGLLCGVRAKNKNVSECILDIGFNSPILGGICFAALKGALDAGLKIPFEEKCLPTKERVYGHHVDKSLKAEIEKIKQEIMG